MLASFLDGGLASVRQLSGVRFEALTNATSSRLDVSTEAGDVIAARFAHLREFTAAWRGRRSLRKRGRGHQNSANQCSNANQICSHASTFLCGTDERFRMRTTARSQRMLAAGNRPTSNAPRLT